MKSFLTVLKFELGNYFKNKSFMMTTLVLALLLAGAIVIPSLFMGKDNSDASDNDEKKQTLALLDEHNYLEGNESLETYLPQYDWINCTSEKELKQVVEEQKAKAGFVVLGETQYTYVVQNSSMTDSIQGAFAEAMAKNYRRQALEKEGMNAASVEAIYDTQIQSETMILGKDSVNNYMYTYVLVFVMYILIIIYGQMIATAVTSEKSNRAIEILVTSVGSNSLIFGKVLAGAISSLLQGGIILGAGVAAYNATKEAWGDQLDFLFNIPGNVWVTFILFGILGYLLYAFIYGMLGALVSKTEDISKSATPITMIYVVAFLVAIVGMGNPDSVLMKVASFIPFTSCNSMFIRVAMGTVSTVEVIVSCVILAASCGLAGLVAAKIFRFGTLMYGNPIKLTSALKKIREK